MPPDALIDLARFEQLGEIPVAPVYAAYPRIYQRHLIPAEAFMVLNAIWGKSRSVLPPVTFHLLRQVFVAAEGLVFTKSGELVAQTRLGHSDDQIKQARAELEELLAVRMAIQRHDRGVLCKKRGAANYGHWLVEMLPKAYWARKEPRLKDWPVVVHEAWDEMPRVILESLDAIGVPQRQVLVTGTEPVFFEELVIVEGLTSHSVFISPRVLECMEAISEKAGRGAAESLYAVRRPAVMRDFEHEPEISWMLEADGYTPIETGQMPFLAQVAAFKSARRVTGPMGAALTNIIFCRPGTEVLMFTPASALEVFFWHIAQAKKLDYHEVRCEEAGEQRGALPWDRALRISTTALRRLLDRLADLRRIAAIEFESTESWPRATVLTVQDIAKRRWQWCFSHAPDVTHEVLFKLGGTILGYSHINEAGWRVAQGALEITAADGQCSWRFEDSTPGTAKMRLQGRFQLDPAVKTMLLLTELG